MRTLILATTNPTKIEKLSNIFGPYFENIQSEDFALNDKEASEGFEESAAIKAVAMSRRYNCPAVAVDGDMADTSHKEAIAIANNGKLLFAEEIDGRDTADTWGHLEEMVDWFMQAK